VALASAACVKVERHATTGLPPQMLGAWSGSWRSTLATQQGPVALRLQQFEGKPVVQIDTTHPCLQEGEYQFVLGATQLELLRDGDVVFQAAVDLPARRFTGTYHCHEDSGTWTASWDHELPALGDIGGLWTGTFAAGTVSRAFTMSIDQRWENGILLLDGQVVVEGLGVGFPITSGQVDFQGSTFDLRLRGNQVGTELVVQGAGSIAGGGTCAGLVLADDGSGQLVIGTWSATRQGTTGAMLIETDGDPLPAVTHAEPR
jgi:hypothetical protein